MCYEDGEAAPKQFGCLNGLGGPTGLQRHYEWPPSTPVAEVWIRPESPRIAARRSKVTKAIQGRTEFFGLVIKKLSSGLGQDQGSVGTHVSLASEELKTCRVLKPEQFLNK